MTLHTIVYHNLIEYEAPINIIKLNLSEKNNSTFNLKMRKKLCFKEHSSW